MRKKLTNTRVINSIGIGILAIQHIHGAAHVIAGGIAAAEEDA